MNSDVKKKLALYEELEASIKLIQLGLGEFQNLDSANDFYHLPFQLISSGFERLMKCHICLGHLEAHGKFPDPKLFKHKLKHDLLEIKEHIIKEYFKTESIPVLEDDLRYITENQDLDYLIKLLSEFGKFARYYNLDVVTGTESPSIDVNSLWQEYETSLLINDSDLLEKIYDLEKQKEASDTITRIIIIKLESFTRAIAHQFTLGQLGTLAQQYSPAVFSFLMLRDNELGTTDYRKQTTKYKEKERKPHKRSLLDEIQRKTKESYVSKKISKNEFDGDWPFYIDEVIIECRDQHWCVVSIDGYDYALNGSAKGRFKIEDAHDAGMAVLGKSTGAFINMALELGKQNNITSKSS